MSPYVSRATYLDLCRTAGEAGAVKTALEWARADIEALKTALALERQRANNAVDELLAVRGMAPVTPPPEPTIQADRLLQENPAEVERIEAEMLTRGYGLIAEVGR